LTNNFFESFETVDHKDFLEHLKNFDLESESEIDLIFDPNKALPKYEIDKDVSFYHYKGSQTAPPCNENMHWIILDKKFHIKEYEY